MSTSVYFASRVVAILLLLPSCSINFTVHGAGTGSGEDNIADGKLSFVGGGKENTASGDKSFIGGGQENTASGVHSFIAGGFNNEVTGTGGNS